MLVRILQTILAGALTQEANYLVSLTRRIWANAGNVISRQYSGADSNVASTGWANKLSSMMTGVQRYIQKTFSDKEKQECIKIFLNRNALQHTYGFEKAIQARV